MNHVRVTLDCIIFPLCAGAYCKECLSIILRNDLHLGNSFFKTRIMCTDIEPKQFLMHMFLGFLNSILYFRSLFPHCDHDAQLPLVHGSPQWSWFLPGGVAGVGVSVRPRTFSPWTKHGVLLQRTTIIHTSHAWPIILICILTCSTYCFALRNTFCVH